MPPSRPRRFTVRCSRRAVALRSRPKYGFTTSVDRVGSRLIPISETNSSSPAGGSAQTLAMCSPFDQTRKSWSTESALNRHACARAAKDHFEHPDDSRFLAVNVSDDVLTSTKLLETIREIDPGQLARTIRNSNDQELQESQRTRGPLRWSERILSA